MIAKKFKFTSHNRVYPLRASPLPFGKFCLLRRQNSGYARSVIRHCQRGKNMIKIIDVLNELGKKRPVFHSEADFQHALAWTIHEKYSGLNIRLEKRVILNNKGFYFDIFAFNDNKTVAIEVKYKTKNLDTAVNSEEFNLKNQGAQDQGRYDFIKDISRLEKALETYRDGAGFAIFLTNDESYWKTPKRDVNTADKDFRIHERGILGTLSWKEGTSKGTMSGRSESIILKRGYMLNWNDYSDVAKQNGKFRYLLVKIAHGNSV